MAAAAIAAIAEPVLDANGDEVPSTPGQRADDGFRLFMSGRVPAPKCPHYMYASEARAGFETCERCAS